QDGRCAEAAHAHARARVGFPEEVEQEEEGREEEVTRQRRHSRGTATSTDATATVTIAMTCQRAGPAAAGQTRSIATAVRSCPSTDPSPIRSTPVCPTMNAPRRM